MGAFKWPLIPYTPPQLRGASSEVVFKYRMGADAHDELSVAIEQLRQLEPLRSAVDAHRSARVAVEVIRSGGEDGELDEGHAETLRGAEDKLARIGEMEATAREQFGIGADDPVPARYDIAATALGHVLVSVTVDGESQSYPAEHAERVAFLRGLMWSVVLQLVIGIKSQQFNDPGN